MGALPNKLTGFQDVEDDEARAKFEVAWGCTIPSDNGWNLTQMFEAMGRDELKAIYCIGENPVDSEADATHARALLDRLDMLVVQDVFMTRTAEIADVVFPAALGWAASDGTASVASSGRGLPRRPPERRARKSTSSTIWRQPWVTTSGVSSRPNSSGRSCGPYRPCMEACPGSVSRPKAASSGLAPPRTIQAAPSSTAASGSVR